MRVSALVATVDKAYTEHISEYISEYHADALEISVCNTAGKLREMLGAKRYNVALIDSKLIDKADLRAVDLPMLLWAEGAADTAAFVQGAAQPAVQPIRKYRRISKTVSYILEQYAAVSGSVHIPGEPEGSITAVWSPCGGVGKTTVALAYAASTALREREVLYLNLESFTAACAYFSEQGKSISTVFEMLDNNSGNAGMYIKGIQSCENGISYLGAPDNFEDMCILTAENIRELITLCAGITGELVIDLSNVCDARTRQVFELADKVLLVTDASDTARLKLTQFVSQSSVFESIKEKLSMVVNKRDTQSPAAGSIEIPGTALKAVINLPYIQAGDEQYIYKTLAKSENWEMIVMR